MTDLGTLGGNESAVRRDQRPRPDRRVERHRVAGHEHAFLWQNGHMIDLGTLGRAERGRRRDQRPRPGRRATASERTTAASYPRVPLGERNDDRLGDAPRRNVRVDAAAINSHGQIVGWATTKNGQTHAVLWTLRSG